MFASACEPAPSRIPVEHLCDRFDPASVSGTAESALPAPRTEWRFDDAGAAGDDSAAAPVWRAVEGVEGTVIRGGKLCGTTRGDLHLLSFALPVERDEADLFHALEVRLSVSKGAQLGAAFWAEEELDPAKVVEGAKEREGFLELAPLSPTPDVQTLTLRGVGGPFNSSAPLEKIRHVLLSPTDAADAEFAIESVRLITRREHLAAVPPGIGWHGLSEIYREAIAARAPERFEIAFDLPERPVLDLALGTLDEGAVTFVVSSAGHGELLSRTLTRANQWQPLALDLADLAGPRAQLSFALESAHAGAIGLWGTLVVRSRGAEPLGTPLIPLANGPHAAPQGVILLLVDTLRSDHLQPYGYERPTAPTLARMAEGGALFLDNISQASWTKVSVASILTSLYATTHGVLDIPDRVSASVVTLAEAFRGGGYATFATSSVAFSGKLTNLHQGVEVLHERNSLPIEGSKTGRDFVDRLLPWLEDHRDVPFFVTLHVFDPHSPFEPTRPWSRHWVDDASASEHAQRLKTLEPLMKSAFMRRQGLPTRAELASAQVDEASFVRHEIGWYDGSIRALDAEVARILERLEELGLTERTLIALISDHGEEFLEHGRHWHGNTSYGEMINVPLLLYWPGTLPAGRRIDVTTRSIDLMPTLLDLAGLPKPDRAQGQSLVPLLAAPNVPESLGWRAEPAFSERVRRPTDNEPDPREVDSFAVIWKGWKLIHNVARPDDFPEYELFDHASDPLDAKNVATEHPELVAELSELLASWRKRALEARPPSDEEAAAEMDPAELERLKSLGYAR